MATGLKVIIDPMDSLRSWKYARGLLAASAAILVVGLAQQEVHANPQGGIVTQGKATFSTSGSHLTIDTSAQAHINWSSFNIAPGETTTFVQPTSASVVWNQINGLSPSQILGNLNANGYVVLQNQYGFYVGGQAAITTHGLIMTTTALPMPDISSGGAWSFTAPPPTAKIINYGHINLTDGGSGFLIADDIENNGTISAPGGNVGLYAGETVLLSTRPDGRGLSAKVTLPQGSVDNQGQLIADGGTIALHAQVVNQGGLIQADSVRNVNGTIELVASDSVNLGASSVISAAGASEGVSHGGTVKILSDNAFSDVSGSTISVAGGAQGGNGGRVEISAVNLGPIQSSIDGHAAAGFRGGQFTLDPYDLTLTSAYVSSLTPILNGSFYEINLEADDDIVVSTLWQLKDLGSPAVLTLTAGNDIIFNNNSGIKAVLTDVNGNPTLQNNWSVDLVAGTELTSAAGRQSGSDGIYLLGNSFIQTYNGSISLQAANEVIINAASDAGNNGNPINVTLPNGTVVDALSSGSVGSGATWNGVRTIDGGSISVTTQYGDVNTGGNPNGYTWLTAAPNYRVNSSELGGISTANGGDVTINAGGNVISFLPIQNDYPPGQVVLLGDGGTGAFGPNPGNVSIVAGLGVSGHYVVADGTGSITAKNGDIGAPAITGGFALSLIKGSWDVSAPYGNIYVQDVDNPDGIFNDKGSISSSPAYHYFDYDPLASVTFSAGESVEITGAGAPQTPPSLFEPIPFIFPPTLNVTAASFVLDQDVILFPSPNGDLHIKTTGGDFEGNGHDLIMSDSAAHQYNQDLSTFGITDHGPTPLEVNNPDPVTISVTGDLDDITLYTTKETQISVTGSAKNANLVGENLHSGDVTSVDVTGSITYSPIYVFAGLKQRITSADPAVSPAWDTIFSLLVNPTETALFALKGNEDLATLQNDVQHLKVFAAGANGQNPFVYTPSANPGFLYDSATKQLGYAYQMSPTVLAAMTGTLEIIQADRTGRPILVKGQVSKGQDPSKYYFATTTVKFVPASVIVQLYTESQGSLTQTAGVPPGFQIGGPGKLSITAGSMDMGSSEGIISWGIGFGSGAARDYSDLASLTPFESGAAISVNVGGDLSMLSSTIASVFGGAVTVDAGGEIDLSQGQFTLPLPNGYPTYGIYTSGRGNVDVTSVGNINIGSSRIATFNGGDVTVLSTEGSVNAGFGANSVLIVPDVYRNAAGKLVAGQIGDNARDPRPFGSGILAIAPSGKYALGDGEPGNITVDTPQGNIVSTLGGIEQFVLNGTIAAGPTVTLTAGTPASGGSPAIKGNINLGAGGVVGGTVNLTAQGNISGLIESTYNSSVTAAQNVSVTLLAGGTANVSASGSVSGTVIGVGGVTASGSSITASLMSQSVSANGAAATSTLGTSAAATSTSQAAAQQANTQTQQIANNDTSQDDEEKKKKALKPALTRRVGRVRVILPKAL